MSVRKSVTISLSLELLRVAERLVAQGRYGNISEVMRTALRALDEREVEFQAHCENRLTETMPPLDSIGSSTPMHPETLGAVGA